jgi:peptide/nickel transport system permease protein
MILAIPTLIGLTMMIFCIMRILPGDPLGTFMTGDYFRIMTDEEVELLREDLGLNKPLYLQYWEWVRDVMTGSFGRSHHRNDPIINTINTRGIISLEIGILAVLFSWVLGLPVGIISALKPNSLSDVTASTTTVLFLAIPNFWLGLIIILFTVTLWGYHPPLVASQIWEDPWQNFQIVVGPVVVLGTSMAAIIARMARSSLFEVLREDYVRTARSKGLVESMTILRHAVPNALLPVLTLSGVMLGFALGGSVAVEVAFGTPGIGKTMVSAAFERDMSVVQSLVLLYGMIFMVVNLIVDVLYGWIDPRVRLS